MITVIDGTGIYIYTADTASSHTFSINGFVQEVVKIDRKYLPSTESVLVTLSASGWDTNAKTQTVSVSKVTATVNLITTAAPDSYMAYAKACVRCTAQGAGTLTFACETVPTADVAANVLILG